MQKSLEKLLVITGANKGIGYNAVEKLLANEDDYNILLTSRDKTRGEEAVAKLKKDYPNRAERIYYHQLDVTVPKSIEEFIAFLKENSLTVQVLVNNAGVVVKGDNHDPEFFCSEEEVKHLMNTNVHGLISLTQGVLPFLAKDGKIVNVSSGLGQLIKQGPKVQEELSNPDWTLEKFLKYVDDYQKLAIEKKQVEGGFSKAVYQISKALVNAYTRWVLKPQLKEDQTCFCLHPGWVQTDMGGQNADLKVDEGSVSTLHCIRLPLEDAKKNNGLFFNFDATVRDF